MKIRKKPLRPPLQGAQFEGEHEAKAGKHHYTSEGIKIVLRS